MQSIPKPILPIGQIATAHQPQPPSPVWASHLSRGRKPAVRVPPPHQPPIGATHISVYFTSSRTIAS